MLQLLVVLGYRGSGKIFKRFGSNRNLVYIKENRNY
jgi:hypothetical protein